MTKKVEIPERFDLVSIKYKNGCKGLASAPRARVFVGEKVITEWDEGEVIGLVGCCTPEDEYYKLLCDVYTVDKITHKIVEVKE